MAPGRPYQLSDSCLHSMMDASPFRDGPFNFWQLVGFFNYLFALLMWKHVDMCVRISIPYLRTKLIMMCTYVNRLVTCVSEVA